MSRAARFSFAWTGVQKGSRVRSGKPPRLAVSEDVRGAVRMRGAGGAQCRPVWSSAEWSGAEQCSVRGVATCSKVQRVLSVRM